MDIQIIPIRIEKDFSENDDIVNLILSSSEGKNLREKDIIVITQKIISKLEGSIKDLSKISPSLLATGIASEYGKNPKIVQLILDQTNRIIRLSDGIIIVETHQGFVCANGGVDESNVKNGFATILPKNPDESAKKIQEEIKKKGKKNVAVIISDTFGRPFREGQTNCAIGVAGISSIVNYAGTKDTFGKTLHVSEIAIADEICSAGELVMGKALNIPIVIVRNYEFNPPNGSVSELIRKKSNDLFR